VTSCYLIFGTTPKDIDQNILGNIGFGELTPESGLEYLEGYRINPKLYATRNSPYMWVQKVMPDGRVFWDFVKRKKFDPTPEIDEDAQQPPEQQPEQQPPSQPPPSQQPDYGIAEESPPVTIETQVASMPEQEPPKKLNKNLIYCHHLM
jgi:hypothetical protein